MKQVIANYLRHFFLIGGIIIMTIPTYSATSRQAGIDLPTTWTVFTPVDAKAVDLTQLQAIPVDLPGDAAMGAPARVLPQQAALVDHVLNFAYYSGGVRGEKAAIAFAVINSPDKQTIKIGTGADWWMEWFVNGKSVFSTMVNGNVSGEFSIYDYTINLPLEKGANLVAVKVLSGSNTFKLWCGGPSAITQRQQRTRALVDAANKRIEQVRKGTLIIKTKPGERVTVRQLTNEFKFGTCISDRMLTTTNPNNDTQQYQHTLKTYFNAAVHEGSMKWPAVERTGPTPNFTTPDASLAWCEANGISMRGHCIFWALEENVPAWVKALDNTGLLANIERRAKAVTSHYRGRIHEYDLNNEMLHSDYFEKRLGPAYFGDMARWAKEGDPDAVLYLNEYDVPTGIKYNLYTDMLIAQVKACKDKAIPIGGIGCQCHYLEDIPLEQVQANLERLAQLGLPISITEFDIGTTDEAKKAELLDAFYRISFANPAVDGILMWGFWEGAKWIKTAYLWKRDWSLTPAGQAYVNLVTKEWRTNTTAVADRAGVCRIKGFYGQYEVQVGGKTQRVTLASAEKEKSITLLP